MSVTIPPPLHPESADAALAVFRELRIPDMPGMPTMGEACGQWVFDLVRAIFGGYDPATGEQAIKTALLLVSKKNSKSTIAAAMMLTLLIRHWRNNDELLILAPTREAAGSAYDAARGMVMADPDLQDLLHVRDHIKTIENRVSHNALKIVSASTQSVAGKKAAFVLIDELHEFGKIANADNILMEATGGQISRPEGFTIYLTTQSDEPPAGVFAAKLHYARKVRDGEIDDPSFLPILYEFTPSQIQRKDYLEPANFEITNPNIGRSVSRQWLENELQRRLRTDDGDGSLQHFLAKHLNVQISVGMSVDHWAGADYWIDAEDDTITLDAMIERSEVITVGVDGGGLDDMLALYVMGRTADGQKLGWGHAWLTEKATAIRGRDSERYRDLARSGDLTIVPRVGPDIAQLADSVARVHASGRMDCIGCDPAGIGQVVEALTDRGIPEDRIIGVSQGWKMTSAVKTAERWLADGSLTVARQELMRWSVGNARCKQSGNALVVTKALSGKAKIDAVMALFDAASVMMLDPQPKNKKLVFFSV